MCNVGIDATKGKAYDYAKLAKIMARKGNAFLKMERMDESIQCY